MADLAVYRGRFGEREAERLLWRAGFGPRPGEVRALARLASRRGLEAAVRSLTRPPRKARLVGPEPLDEAGLPLAPFDARGHDALWWLDRMVRSTQPFVERMALIWHDWFATADVRQELSIEQTNTFRRFGLGSFSRLLEKVTTDPAMLVWLSGVHNTKHRPNENYARELMELFTLGASDANGWPYSESDVREQARALTGWRADWVEDLGYANFRFDPSLHDTGVKTIFGRSGPFDWKDSCRLCLEHPAHPGYFVSKLWSYFIPTPPKARDRKLLERRYVSSGFGILAVVESILMHPKLYEGPSLVKPPAVYVAGLHRARERGVRGDWARFLDLAGQRPFQPPDVAGWDDDRWFNTSTFRGRWMAANEIVRESAIDFEQTYDSNESEREALRKAIDFWGNPTLSPSTRRALTAFCKAVERAANEPAKQGPYRAMRQNALRILIATSPDMQAS